ncbi:MAG: translesion error-prone DNA polymerase V autoproteolytic subunit [Pseudomonadota bacterium]
MNTINIKSVALYSLPCFIPLMSHSISAGFPSPAEDYIEHGIDLNERLILNRATTFVLRVAGDSMIDAGIWDGDEIIVDRSITPSNNDIVVAAIDNQLVIKRLKKTKTAIYLLAENPAYSTITIKKDQELVIWGVATCVLHKLTNK